MDCEICTIAKIYSRCYTCPIGDHTKQGVQLCQNCDKNLHPPNQPSGLHRRGMLCSECEEEDAYGYCEDCEQYMCQACSKLIHNKGARLRHVLDHQKLLDEGWYTKDNTQTLPQLQVAQAEQVSARLNFQNNNQARNNLIQIQVTTPRRTVINTKNVHQSEQNEKEETKISPIKDQKKGAKASQQTQFQTFLPLFQPLMLDPSDPFLSVLLYILREQASQGNLMIPYQTLLDLLFTMLSLQTINPRELLVRAEQQGHLIVTVRNLGCVKNLTLVSMRLPFITVESVQWVLKGLKRDGMCPNERAIQSRIKEAFGVKVNTQMWDMVVEGLESIKEHREINREEAMRELSNISLKVNSRIQFSYQDQLYIEQLNILKEIKYRVEVTEKHAENNEGQQGTSFTHFYIKNEYYVGQDQQFNGPIISHIKDQRQMQLEIQRDKIIHEEFRTFLFEYFTTSKYDDVDLQQRINEENDDYLKILNQNCINQKCNKQLANKRNPALKVNSTTNPQSSLTISESSDSANMAHNASPSSNFNEDGKAIPGGRYGCAQFVKLCGPSILKEQSLGKLAQMVQRTINEDFLRYQRTLLVLTDCIDKSKVQTPQNHISYNSEEEYMKQIQKKAEIGAKLQAVKQSIIEVLAENKQGVSLPQLPIFLKRKLPFKLDWNQLGFAKLKDLIMSMSDQIKLELIGPNHTLAYLIYSNRYHHTNGAHSDDLQNIPRLKPLISEKQKYSIDYFNKDFKHNLLVADSQTLEQILALFYQMLKEFPMGIDSQKIVPWISQSLGAPFELRAYGCHSVYEFINKFVMPTTEIVIITNKNKPDSFLIRSNQIYTNMQPQPESYQQPSESNSSAQSSVTPSGDSHSSQVKPSKQLIINHGANSSIGGVPMGSISPKSSSIIDSSGLEQPTMPKKKQNKRNKKNRAGKESQDGSHEYAATNGGGAQQNANNQKPMLGQQAQITYDGVHQNRRMPSGASTFHMPGASSFYGQPYDESQSKIQINISHIRYNTDGELGSQNATQIHHHHQGHQNSGGTNNQLLLPQHFYNSSNDFNPQSQEWTLQKHQNGMNIFQVTNQQVQHQQQQAMQNQKMNNPQKRQINHQPIMKSGIVQPNNSFGSCQDNGFQSFGSKNNNAQIIPQLNPLQLYDLNNDSVTNSPRGGHNRAVSYLNSLSSSQDFSMNLNSGSHSFHHAPLFSGNPFNHNTVSNNGMFFNNFGSGIGKREEMQVHKEASKESSLEGASQQSNKDGKIQNKEIKDDEHNEILQPTEEEINPDSSIVNEEDENQSPLHSQFIEDLLGDGDQTDLDLTSQQSHSQSTTVVHTPHLSMSSFYKQLPPTQGSSYYPANQGIINFDQSVESDDANVHLMMNNLMIQVGNNNQKLIQGFQTAKARENDNQEPPVTTVKQNLFPQMPQNSVPKKQADQDNAQYMHSKAMSEDFNHQGSIFGNQFMFNPYLNDQNTNMQQPHQPYFQERVQQRDQYSNYPLHNIQQTPNLQKIQVEIKQPQQINPMLSRPNPQYQNSHNFPNHHFNMHQVPQPQYHQNQPINKQAIQHRGFAPGQQMGNVPQSQQMRSVQDNYQSHNNLINSLAPETIQNHTIINKSSNQKKQTYYQPVLSSTSNIIFGASSNGTPNARQGKVYQSKKQI